ncbi:hypothetical protein KHQ81_06285 [Mycoplasmatota bacterium]|nr:hypothetical protein KHQ81_06285 [Mycoplasmatota bacterium]
MPIHTDVKAIFSSLEGLEEGYNWLITDFELNYYPKEFKNKEIIWISGEELSNILNTNNIQFIWGVLSGFNKSINIDINKLDIVPFADGNTTFWTNYAEIQHPLASVEIVCFDSSLTIFSSNNNDILQKFNNKFSDAVDLKRYNSFSK